ncbi:MAG: hypothetical protein ACREOQ_22435 [Gemmatimonadales bacterium]
MSLPCPSHVPVTATRHHGASTGVRSGTLSGSAEAEEIFIETGSAFVVRMFAPSGSTVRFVILHGTLVEGSDTVGVTSVAGSFRAKVFP